MYSEDEGTEKSREYSQEEEREENATSRGRVSSRTAIRRNKAWSCWAKLKKSTDGTQLRIVDAQPVDTRQK